MTNDIAILRRMMDMTPDALRTLSRAYMACACHCEARANELYSAQDMAWQDGNDAEADRLGAQADKWVDKRDMAYTLGSVIDRLILLKSVTDKLAKGGTVIL